MFIKGFMSHSKTSAAAVVLALLSGCNFLPTVGGDAVMTDKVVTENMAAEQPSLNPALNPTLNPSLNPYLQNAKQPSSAAQSRFSEVIAAIEAQDWSQAETLLLAFTERYPDLSGGYLNLGIVYRQQEKPQLAADYLQQAIDANPLNLNAYNELAILKREQGDFTAAEQLYGKALSVWPDHAASHYNMAILCELYLGDLSRARHHFGRYQQLMDTPDRKVSGWIKDLDRRIQALARNGVSPQ